MSGGVLTLPGERFVLHGDTVWSTVDGILRHIRLADGHVESWDVGAGTSLLALTPNAGAAIVADEDAGETWLLPLDGDEDERLLFPWAAVDAIATDTRIVGQALDGLLASVDTRRGVSMWSVGGTDPGGPLNASPGGGHVAAMVAGSVALWRMDDGAEVDRFGLADTWCGAYAVDSQWGRWVLVSADRRRAWLSGRTEGHRVYEPLTLVRGATEACAVAPSGAVITLMADGRLDGQHMLSPGKWRRETISAHVWGGETPVAGGASASLARIGFLDVQGEAHVVVGGLGERLSCFPLGAR